MKKIIEIDPKDIIVEERLREDLGNIAELCKSISLHGQLMPVVVEELGEGKYRLIAGGRRTEACKRLKRKVQAHVISKGALDDEKRLVLEISENLIRKDFSPLEKASGIAQLHEMLKQKAYPNEWSARKTAEVLGVSHTSVNDALAINAVSSQIDIGEAKKMKWTQLRRIVRTSEKQRQALEIARRAVEKAKQVDKIKEIDRAKLMIGDFLELQKELKPESFDLILTDPPWGIEYQKLSITKGKEALNYEDKFDYEFASETMKACYRLLKPDGKLLLFHSIIYFGMLSKLAEEVGFKRVQRTPIIWIKGIAGPQPNPQYYCSNCYEPILLAHKSSKSELRTRGVPNWVQVGQLRPSELRHPAEKPIDLYRWLIRLAVAPGFTMLDPFMGSGNSLAAAFIEGAVTVTGIDINPECKKLAYQSITGEYL